MGLTLSLAAIPARLPAVYRTSSTRCNAPSEFERTVVLAERVDTLEKRLDMLAPPGRSWLYPGPQTGESVPNMIARMVTRRSLSPGPSPSCLYSGGDESTTASRGPPSTSNSLNSELRAMRLSIAGLRAALGEVRSARAGEAPPVYSV